MRLKNAVLWLIYLSGISCVVYLLESHRKSARAEFLLKTGQEVVLTGKLTPNTWTDKNGAEHQDIEIVVNKIRDLTEE